MSFEIRITATSKTKSETLTVIMELELSPLFPTIPTFGSRQAIDHAVEGRIVLPAEAPRSCIVETPSGQVRQNCLHLNPTPDDAPVDHTQRPGRDPMMTRTRTATAIHPPDRL